MSPNIDVFKPVRQKNGRSVTILSVAMDENSAWPINALVEDKDGNANIHSFSSEGIYSSLMRPSVFDLENFEPPVEHTFWANIYSAILVPDVYFHGDEEDAKDARRGQNGALACVKVTYTEGEGLD